MKAIAYGLIIVVPLLIIYDIYGHAFVSWDDKENYLENVKIRNGLTFTNLYWLITDCTLLGVWEPTSTFVKLSLVTLFHSSSKEMVLSPSIFLLANLTIHICNSLLVFFKVLPSNESNIFVRLFATFIFAIHPQRIEPVAWASCLPYTLACFFSILSFVEYKNSSTNNNCMAWKRTIYLFLGMTSKIPAIGLLMVFLTGTFFKNKQRNSLFLKKKTKKNGNKRMFKEIFKVIIETMKEHRYDISVSIVCVCLAFKANLVSESHNLSLFQRLGRASYSLFWYLSNTITLAEPNIIYAVETENMSILNFRYGFFFLLLLFCLGTSLFTVFNAGNTSNQKHYKRKIMEILSMGFLLFVGIMFPSLQVIQHGYLTLGSDRYMYIPTAIVITPFISKILHVALFDINIYQTQRGNRSSAKPKTLKYVDKRSNLPPSPRRSTATTMVGGSVVKKLNRNAVVTPPSLWAVYACMIAYLSISIAGTASNVKHWSDSVSLWSHAKHYIENSTMIDTEHSPVLSEIVLNLAATYQENKEFEKSHLFHLEALKLNNRSAHGYNNLVTLLVEMRKEGLLSKQFDSSAVKAARKAIELDPTMSESMANLAMLYDYEENRWEAIEWYEKALKAAEEDVWKRKHSFIASKSKGTRVLNNPGFYLAYGNAIQATKKKGSLLTAYECYQRAYTLNPKFPLINEKMAKYQGDPHQKVKFLHKEVELFPDNSDAFYNLGNAYLKLQKYTTAIDYYLKSLEIKPKATDAMLNIAVIYLQNLKNCKESIRWAYKILNEDANHSRAKTILKRCGDI
eukprot:g8106.t1